MTGLTLLLVLVPAIVGLLPVPGLLALRRSRQEGVDFRTLAALHAARRIDTVVLDRWGTITTGELVVSDVDPLEEGNERTLRWFAAALEHAADDHPVARAIARLAGPGKLTDVESSPGRGISGAVDRHPVRVGSPAWLGMETRDGLGQTVGVEVDHRPFGYLTVSDQVRADAALAVARLRACGVAPILLSDADALDTEHLAQASGIDKWLVGKDSPQRRQLVRDQRGTGHSVAVVAPCAGNAEVLTAGDLAFTDGDIGPAESHVRMVDLDVQRVAQALELVRGLPAASLRARVVGALVSSVGALGVALERASVVGAGACMVGGCVAVALVAVASIGRRRQAPVAAR